MRIAASVLLLLAHGFVPGLGSGAISQNLRHYRDTDQIPIRLVLRTTKSRWLVNEPNEITAYLENASDASYYVGKTFFGFGIISSFHYVELEIIDEQGTDALGPRMSVTQIWKDGTSIPQKIEQEYMKLDKNMIHGLTARGDWNLRPGRYRLMAKYHEVEARHWTDAERLSLPFPVWTQTLTSNAVIITVGRRKRAHR